MTDVVRRGGLSRRRFLRLAGAGGLAGFAGLGTVGALLNGCGSDEGTSSPRGSTSARLPATLKVGVITAQSGIAAFLGTIVERSLAATERHVNESSLLPGTTVGYEIVNAPVEEGADGTQRAYARFAADPDVIGIVWATPSGLREALPQITRDQMPVLGVYSDLYSEGVLDAAATPTVFQLLPPTPWLLDVMAEYAVNDRGYRTAGILVDNAVQSNIESHARESARAAGLEVVSEQTFSLFSADYGAQLQALRRAAPECVFVWGLVDNIVGIVRQLEALGAAYIDTPTAKSADGWHPHLLANAAGIEKTFGEKAGSAARQGMVASWYVGGAAVGAIDAGMRKWLLAADEGEPLGGEEGPADAVGALLEAVRLAGSTDRRRVVERLNGLRTTFSSLPFTLDAETHVGVSRDDLTMVAFERGAPVETDPPYEQPGQYGITVTDEFSGAFQLHRPTHEANMRAQPDFTEWALENRWGIVCAVDPPDAVGAGVAMTNDCKIH